MPGNFLLKPSCFACCKIHQSRISKTATANYRVSNIFSLKQMTSLSSLFIQCDSRDVTVYASACEFVSLLLIVLGMFWAVRFFYCDILPAEYVPLVHSGSLVRKQGITSGLLENERYCILRAPASVEQGIFAPKPPSGEST